MARLSDKILFITGANAGIGLACAVAAAAEGAVIALADLEQVDHTFAMEQVRALSPRSIFVPVDVSSEVSVETAIARTVKAFGRIDVAVNNAGISMPTADIHEMDADVWGKVIDVNLSGSFYCAKHELRQFLKQGGGNIVSVASVAGLLAIPGSVHYTASKHGVLGLIKTIAARYGAENIRANAVCPYYTDTAMTSYADKTLHDMWIQDTPMNRLGTSEEVGSAVVFLASSESSFCNGAVLVLDGGKSIK